MEPVLQFQTLLTTVGPLIQENVSLVQGNSVISAVGGSSACVTPVLYIRTFGDHRYAQESINTPIALQPQLLSGLIWKQGLIPFSNGETDRALHLTRDLFLLRPLQLHLNCSGLSEQRVEGLAELGTDISPCVVLMIGVRSANRVSFQGAACSSDKLTWHGLGSTFTQRIRQEQEIC